MPPELDPAFSNYLPPSRFDETPTEGMRRIEAELEMPDRPNTQRGRLAAGAGRTLEGYNARLGAQGPVGGGVMVAADPITGQPVMVGGQAQAGPLSYQVNKPTFKGAPASHTIGLGGQPFDADTYFGGSVQQGPSGRTYGANISQGGEDGSGWNAYAGYNPTNRSANIGAGYQTNFAKGGGVRPVVGHTRAAGEPISLEEHKGEIRHRAHSGDSKMAADYGYLDYSKPDHDGAKTDVFVGPHHDSKKVFVVNQQHPRTGKFNEHKVLLGYHDRAHALRDYVHSFSDGQGHKRIQSVVEMGTHQLQDWLKKDHTQPLHKAEGGPVDEPAPRTLTIRRGDVPQAAEAQDGDLRDEDTYGPTNLEERKARIQEMTTPTDYPGDKLEAPQGYITPATAVEWKLGDAGPYAVDAEGKTLPLIKQPGVLPLYRDPTIDSIRPAMPALVDIAGNIMGAPVGMTAGRVIQAGLTGERGAANIVSAMGAGEKSAVPARELSNMGLYSHAAEVAESLPQAKGSPQQMKAMLKGVKQEELAGFDEAFAGQKSVTKDEVAQFFRDQMPVVEETVLGTPKFKDVNEMQAAHDAALERGDTAAADLITQDWESQFKGNTKFSQYSLPGGENYREVLLKMPPEMRHVSLDEVNAQRQKISSMLPSLTQAEYDAMLASGDIAKIEANPNAGKFKSSHWDDPNVLAHLRMSDRTGPNGEKILHVEEIQSDWGQKGKKEGFDVGITPQQEKRMQDLTARVADLSTAEREELGDLLRASGKGGVPSAPYVTKTEGWTDLALKRALKEAAEGGYDKLVWTPGAEQAKRYSLSKQVNAVTYDPAQQLLQAEGPRGELAFAQGNIPPEKIADYIGKEAAEKLLAEKPNQAGYHVLEGEGLDVGGSGMKGYYDKIVPKRLQEIIKKHDPEAKVEMGRLPVPGRNTSGTDIARELGMNVVDINNMRLAGQKKDLINSVRNSIAAPSLTITPKMRESILKGQTAFAEGGQVTGYAKGGEVRNPDLPVTVPPQDLPRQVRNVAHDLARIAHKDKLDQRHLAYLLKVASGMTMPPERAMQFAGQIMTGDVNGLMQRFQTYRPSLITFARLNQMMGGSYEFKGKNHMGKHMQRMHGVDGLQRTKEAIYSAIDSDVVKSRPVMAKALKRLNKRI